uniref:Uncharacterized protein n=1 Tax=Romanomermis culicivorax TaxID=13658 RepID=A0A915HS36_ROMCU
MAIESRHFSLKLPYNKALKYGEQEAKIARLVKSVFLSSKTISKSFQEYEICTLFLSKMDHFLIKEDKLTKQEAKRQSMQSNT